MRLGPPGTAETATGDSPPDMSSVTAGLVPRGSPAPVIYSFLRQASS
jgi:hypothetical protein